MSSFVQSPDLVRTPPRRRRLSWAALTVGLLIAGLLVAVTPQQKAEAAAPGPKDTIAVMFSWTWNAIARECTDTLGPAGYGYVQTSPPQEHVTGSQWWTYYQPVSYKLESRLGTTAEYQNMIDTCGDAGVKVIADAVINHMSGDSDGGTGWAGSSYGHYNYPGIYGENDFHSCRKDISNYQDRADVQNCNLVNLADLDTGSNAVQQKIADYLNGLVDMGVAGFRIDAVKHIAAADMDGIMSKVKNKDDLYIVQEVIRANEPVQPEEYLGVGDVHEFAYARKLKESFGAGKIDWLISGKGIGESWDGFLDSADAGVFVDNHDTERNGETLSYKNGDVYDLAQVFTLAWNYGSPSVHSGYSFSDFDAGPPQTSSGEVIDPTCGSGSVWTCEHAENQIMNMVGFRNATYGTAVTKQWSNDAGSAIAFSRGDKGTVAINRGGELTQSFSTGLPDGEYYNVISAKRDGDTWSGETVTVSGGKFTAKVPANGAVAIHADAVKSTGGGEDPGTDPDPDPEPEPGEDTTQVFYKSNGSWSDYYVHYRVGSGAWTTAPGEKMTEACDGWYGATIDLGDATGITAAFNNGSGTWDSNGSKDYALGSGVQAVASGAVTTTDPCPDDAPTSGDLTVYYKADAAWSDPYAHYRVGTGAWTAAPGTKMEAACEGWSSLTIEGGASGSTLAFNNGSGSWDNNGSKDYVVSGSAVAISSGQVSASAPCEDEGTDPGTDPEDPGTDPEEPEEPEEPEVPGTAVGTDYSQGNYQMNPDGGVGAAAAITVDGDASEWTKEMLIAQGVANDDPRIFRGSHEGPVYDPYSLSSAWDDENLYLMWQFTNVTDVVDPAQGYPISDNGKPYNGDIPQGLAFDVNASGTDGLIDGSDKGVWGLRTTFENEEVDHLALFSSKKGVGEPAVFSLNENDAFDYEPENVSDFADAGISFNYGDGFTGDELLGINANGYSGFVPADLEDTSKYVDFLGTSHDTAQDTVYEMEIPFSALGTTREAVEENGIGVMLLSTFGQSAIGSLPQDPAVLDAATDPYSADESTSAEKEDWDALTAQFARIGG